LYRLYAVCQLRFRKDSVKKCLTQRPRKKERKKVAKKERKKESNKERKKEIKDLNIYIFN
jgi:hypothetical protein